MRSLSDLYPIPGKFPVDSISTYKLKRDFDFVFASVALVISVPFWLMAALAIKLEDRGPILYRQKRWGKDKEHSLDSRRDSSLCSE